MDPYRISFLFLQLLCLLVQIGLYHKNKRALALYRNNVSAASRYRELADEILAAYCMAQLENLNNQVTGFYDHYKPLIEKKVLNDLTSHLDAVIELRAKQLYEPQTKA